MGIKINSPLPCSLATECKKAARILNSFIDAGKGVDIIIPPNILEDAKGLAIFTVLKAGFLFSGRAGSGLVVAKLPDGSWSAPSAIAIGGMGFGGQIGAELTDFIMILNTSSAVKTFMQHGSITLGGNISVAAGPIGRNAEASGTASLKNVSAMYSYSKTRGLFAGVSLEGSVIVERSDANKKMYGRKVKSKDLLNGSIESPIVAHDLYRALELKTHNSIHHSDSGGAGSRFRYRDDDASVNSESTGNVYRSLSRVAVHSMAKTGAGNISYKPADTSRYLGASRFDPPPRQITNTVQARALFNFTGEQEGDLVFHKGDVISIIQKTDTQNDWWTGKLNNRQGIFPANFVEII